MLSRIRFLPSVLFWLGFGLVGAGFIVHGMWNDVPAATALLAALALMVTLLAYAAKRWFHLTLATTAAVTWLCALIWFVGVLPILSVALIVAASIAVGSLFVPKDVDSRGVFAVLAGLAVVCGIDGWLLPFPIHGQATYALALLVVCFLRRRVVLEMVSPWAGSWTAAVEGAPWTALLAIMTLGLVSTCAWLPTIHYDDLATHLGMPYQLGDLGYYRMDAGSQVWSLSAWAGDVLQSVVQVVAGQEARGAVDSLWLMLTAAMMWELCKTLDLPPRMRWLAVAIYASMPLAADALSSMQTEGATAAVAAGIAVLVQRTDRPDRRYLLLTALLFGLLLGLKVSNLMIAGPLGLLLLWRWRSTVPWRAVPVAILLALLVAGSSYSYAWLLTGNPMLPVYNAIFHSPYYAQENFHDFHWEKGLHWNTLWNIVFAAPDYIEGQPGAAGFTFLALAGSLLAALFDRRSRPLVLVAATAFVLPLTQLQYLRYPFPACALLVPTMLCGIPMAGIGLWQRRGMVAMLVLLIVGNLAFVPAGSWQLHNGVLQDFLSESQTPLLAQYSPVRRLAALINATYGESARVLIGSDAIPFAAEFGGKAFVANWYDQQTWVQARAANSDASGKLWQDLLDRLGVNLLILKNDDVPPALTVALEQNQARLVNEDDGLQLWELRRGTPGVETTGPNRGLAVTFKVATAAPQEALLHAQINMSCAPQLGPILVGWTVTRENAAPWQSNRWIYCLQNGQAHAPLDLATPGRIVGVAVTAQPVKPVDIGLKLTSSVIDIRRDLSADRDLASQMRLRMQRAVIRWITPTGNLAAVGHALASPHGSVVARLELPALPSKRWQVDVIADLKCRQADTPIIFGWKIEQEHRETWSHYEWVTCGSDDLAHASIKLPKDHPAGSLTVTAVPREPADMGLQLISLRANSLAVRGPRGSINHKRQKLAKAWLAHTYKITELTP